MLLNAGGKKKEKAGGKLTAVWPNTPGICRNKSSEELRTSLLAHLAQIFSNVPYVPGPVLFSFLRGWYFKD